MTGIMQAKLDKLRVRMVDRFLDFQPAIRELDIAGAPIRFFLATAQAASWYDPLKPRNRRELEWLVAHLPLAGARIIDAGAYHGLYATVFAKAAGPEGEVAAVDPVAANCAVIEANLALNGLRGRVETCAIANTEGEGRFSRASCGHLSSSGGINVPTSRLRSIRSDASVVKLDIEGAEFAVVPEQIDELPEVGTWIVEIHPGSGRDPGVVTEAFRSRGFALWRSDPAHGGMAPYEGGEWRDRATLVAMSGPRRGAASER